MEPGHRGQLARLIRERPVFVNVGGCRGSRSLKRRNWGEYICFRGVFRGETAACPDHRNIRTLAIGNLTGRGPKRILGISVRVRTSAGLVSGGAPNTEISRRIFVSATDDQPTLPAPRPSGPRRLGLSGKLLLLTIPLVMIALLMIYVPSIANFWTNRLNDRLAAANTAALVLDAAPLGHGAGFAGAADPDQRRRARGRHQDGAAAPAARQRRPAGGDRPRHRHADPDGVVCDRRVLRDHAGDRQPDHPRGGARARRRAIHRGGGR